MTKIRIDLTAEQLEAVSALVGERVSAQDLTNGHPLYEAERELDSALLEHERRQTRDKRTLGYLDNQAGADAWRRGR